MSNRTIYLDNAATSWPKPEQVYQNVDSVSRKVRGNPGRGLNSSASLGNKILNDAREEIAGFFNAPSPDYVIFTCNGTDSLNIALKGLINPGSKVLTGPYEHNSVMRPLNSLRERGAIITAAGRLEDYAIDLKSVARICRDGIDFAVISHISNVTGSVADIAGISRIVHSAGGLVILDAAQSAGIIQIDMKELGVDILAAPGHKGLMGPMGTGILVLSDNFSIKPFREGGTGILSDEDSQPENLPFRLEAGTSNLPGIAGLLEGIRFLKSTGLDMIARHESELASRLINGLNQMKGINLYCNTKNPQSGVVSFTADSVEPSVIETILDQAYHIQVRSGLHCSPHAHKSIGTFPAGTVRVSFGYYNTFEEIDTLLSALQSIIH
ncbi:aminotransferase class V-fold PLP-dependent enzyme [Parasporobacterium paucivorans]|uniref:cysteine desulfurase n=1 Tax=Parasporobacterium paucivorans DSM 15970 TaxID=1122934 RepID=A0A1M6E2F4_9FIRM|nr:aminotransferase class V-fold PLP-dependent enzyme [Parasporobacterium paucivorans]SHI79724.1 cysteine desulfurase family protein [Parasporobacterium paucivorans DSM 15970]